MKIDPINILINSKFKTDKPFYFISGNEHTLIYKVKESLIKIINKDGDFDLEKIKDIGSFKNNIGLFNDKKVFLVGGVSGVKEEKLNLLKHSGDIFIFVCENSPKITNVKKIFLQRGDSVVFDCYELSKEAKIKIVNSFFNEKQIKLDQSIYWELIDWLDNKYSLLEKDLQKILEVKSERLDLKTLKQIIARNNQQVERVFFQLFENNDTVVNSYNKNITSTNEVNQLYYTVKQFSNLIINHENIREYENKIPKYLFREKGILLDLYKKFNKKKKKNLLNLLFKTEILLKKNTELSLLTGLRFLLSFKKIVIS